MEQKFFEGQKDNEHFFTHVVDCTVVHPKVHNFTYHNTASALQIHNIHNLVLNNTGISSFFSLIVTQFSVSY